MKVRLLGTYGINSICLFLLSVWLERSPSQSFPVIDDGTNSREAQWFYRASVTLDLIHDPMRAYLLHTAAGYKRRNKYILRCYCHTAIGQLVKELEAREEDALGEARGWRDRLEALQADAEQQLDASRDEVSELQAQASERWAELVGW